jgi:hypothetical protein
VRLVAPVAVALGMAAGAVNASAAPSYRLSVSPKSIGRHGKVMVTTTPHRSCNLQVKIHGKVFSHSMTYGYATVAFPNSELTGRVEIKTTCAGDVHTGSFTIHK